MKKKNWLLILLVISLLVSLCACSSSGKAAAPETEPPAAESTAAPTEQTAPPETEPAAQPESTESVRDAAFYSGTWAVSGVNVKTVDLTLEQAIAMGMRDEICQISLVLTEDGIAHLSMPGETFSDVWNPAENGINIGKESFPFSDNRLSWDTGDDLVIYFEKVSDDQTPPAAAPAATEPETTAPSGIRPEFKEAMDSYEAFYDEYAELMNAYMKNPTDFSLLAKYTEMLGKVDEMDKKFKAWDESDMTSEELKYYLEVSTRIQKKIIDLF